MLPPTARFSSRVGNYVRYRPGYPPEVIEVLKSECGLGPSAAVADVGAGTGIFTRLLLETGARVYAVEPNREMREAAEAGSEYRPNFSTVAATAEATTLPDASVDLVTAAQAMHWFDAAAARAEFARILKPEGNVALIWNSRLENGTRFMEDYEALLRRFAPEYGTVNHHNIDDAEIAAFFAPQPMRVRSFPNAQRMDYEGLQGRLLSSSYAPEAGNPNHLPMLAALRELFDHEQNDGAVEFLYETKVYWGRVKG